MSYDSESLIDRLRREGTKPDWERFIDLYKPLIEHWSRRLSPPDDAADLVQDVFLLVMQKLSSFTGKGDRCFLAWLRAIMVNRSRDLARRKAARPHMCDPSGLQAVAADDEFSKLADAEDHMFVIRRALQIMQTDFEPSTWRAAWESVAADRPAVEVATELGLSLEVVYSATYRVLRRLRKELAATRD
jgi:RNA polymerase sigma-70 factor (ECF subfamily)